MSLLSNLFILINYQMFRFFLPYCVHAPLKWIQSTIRLGFNQNTRIFWWIVWRCWLWEAFSYSICTGLTDLTLWNPFWLWYCDVSPNDSSFWIGERFFNSPNICARRWILKWKKVRNGCCSKSHKFFLVACVLTLKKIEFSHVTVHEVTVSELCTSVHSPSKSSLQSHNKRVGCSTVKVEEKLHGTKLHSIM